MFRVVDQFYFHDHGTHAEANRYVTTTNAIWIGDIKKSFQLKRHRLFKNQMGRLQLARLSHAAAAATAMVMMMMTLRSEIVHSQLILNADGPWADKLWQMYATHRHTHDHVYNSSSAPLSVVLYFYFFFSFSFVLYVIHLSVHDSCVAGIALLMLFFSIRPFHFALNNNGHIYAFRYECVCIVFVFYSCAQPQKYRKLIHNHFGCCVVTRNAKTAADAAVYKNSIDRNRKEEDTQTYLAIVVVFFAMRWFNIKIFYP